MRREAKPSRASATAKGVEDQESLKTSALISKFTNPVKDKINNLFSDGVVSTSIIVGSILLASDELLRVE